MSTVPVTLIGFPVSGTEAVVATDLVGYGEAMLGAQCDCFRNNGDRVQEGGAQPTVGLRRTGYTCAASSAKVPVNQISTGRCSFAAITTCLLDLSALLELVTVRGITGVSSCDEGEEQDLEESDLQRSPVVAAYAEAVVGEGFVSEPFGPGDSMMLVGTVTGQPNHVDFEDVAIAIAGNQN
ncbi:hypothetical protein NE237_011911 [Protea cynaroides]|uniref:Uncharacterized protein n=1 Tax=Protea cynaroides TaxID=273540 RepID=A0A9Q0JYS7_9MAGN|nr:hypothetical protein NE237_011911 [Protea cynaroides]